MNKNLISIICFSTAAVCFGIVGFVNYVRGQYLLAALSLISLICDIIAIVGNVIKYWNR